VAEILTPERLVKIGDFDHWCIEASELVNLMVDLVWRDKKIPLLRWIVDQR